ncbi:TatD family hydrolase [Acidicapsa ligni]|uniref:TatD family hydrolase n=1 Tax=Acidicapsa ligni TaxID=542300 RepID=UPI00295BD633|nr:TatD family hydrolase [Acidicapsa ligni]
MLVDSHAHLDSSRYEGELAEVLHRAWEAGVGTILAIGIGEGPAQMHQALDICRQFNAQSPAQPIEPMQSMGSMEPKALKVPKLYASAGIYPHNTHEADDAALAKLDQLLAEPEVIACGEIGLDYYHEGTDHSVQKRVFIRQMEIATARKRPILIHCRPKDGDDTCWDDTLALLGEHWGSTGIGGILHCFSGDWSQAQRAMDLGFLISFAGQITYPKAQALRDVAIQVPLERLLVETDAPFLAPLPNRGKRNEPAWVAETARALAVLHGLGVEEMADITTKNFQRLFRLS